MSTPGGVQSAFLKQLGSLLREVSAREIMPRFRKLSAADVFQKPSHEDPTDLVTAADRAAEIALGERLCELVAGSSVVGEEAVAADHTLLARLRGSAPVWVVDPLDGTRNFAAGHGPFGVMAALVERGELLASAIYLPERDQVFCAERGQGAYLDGERIVASAAARDASASGALRGTPYARFMPAAARAELEARSVTHTLIPGVTCAAHEYAELALARKDYVVYFRLLPWDHAPGALIVREAGGVVRHPSGRDYAVLDEAELTLAAPSEELWQRAKRELFE